MLINQPVTIVVNDHLWDFDPAANTLSREESNGTVVSLPIADFDEPITAHDFHATLTTGDRLNFGILRAWAYNKPNIRPLHIRVEPTQEKGTAP